MSQSKASTAGIPSKVIIVGGGTAGWMAASLLQHAWSQESHTSTQITVVESEDIGTIGVGEGSTPTLREFFRTLGITDSEWMPKCSATYKCGIAFPGWLNGHDGSLDGYFHPFFSPLDIKSGEAFMRNASLKRRGVDAPVQPDDFFVGAQLSRQFLSPRLSESLPFEPDYAYHFDSALLGKFLRERAKGLGVRHVVDTVNDVQRSALGDIECLYLTQDKRPLKGDFFIDCTGFASLLIGKTLETPFYSYSDNLFNDSAVAIASPLDFTKPIPSHTESTGLSNGWAWKIPLTTRYGNGYVYSSGYQSAESAEQELRKHMGVDDEVEARHIPMRVGSIRQHWNRNCLAVGLSQGFIEPLEATALMLVQYTLTHFINAHSLAVSNGNIEHYRSGFNDNVTQTFAGIRDYIVAHYQCNTRTDSDYWIDNRSHNHISDSLGALLQCWDEGGDFEAELSAQQHKQVYPRPSWYCLLAGSGRFPVSGRRIENTQGITPTSPAAVREYCIQMSLKFQDHQTLLRDMYGDKFSI
jgi:flavin-dependent dehydrogenase